MNVQVLGISVDHVPCLKAWAESLGGITYPLLSDFYPHGGVAEKYGVLRPEGKSERAIFIMDKNGVIQYIDIHDIDDQPDNEVLFAELKKIDPEAFANVKKEEPAAEMPQEGIIMYCNTWCPDCRRAEMWFNENDIEFTRVDVIRVPGAREKARELADGKLVTPTFDVNGTVVLDFKAEGKAQLEKLLLS